MVQALLATARAADARPRGRRARRRHLPRQPRAAARRGGGARVIALVAGEVAVRRPDHVVVETAGGVGYRLAVSAETLRHVPAVGRAGLAAHAPRRARRRAGAVRLRHRGGARPLPGAHRRAVGRSEGRARRALERRPAARARRRRSPPATARACRPCPGIGKRTAERIVVELREKVGGAGDEAPGITITRGDDPRHVARDGLLELGFAARRGAGAARRGRRRHGRGAAGRARCGRPAGEPAAHPDARARSAARTTSTARCARAAWRSSSARRACASSSRSRSQAATARGEALDHVLLAGPPGLGKTSLAQIVAAELDVPFVQTAGPALERKGDIAALLTALEPRAVFFVDEIHRLNRALEETFYPAMEDRRLPITIGQGAGARVVTLDLPPFTLVGATTRAGLLTTPLRDRFGIQHRLEPYDRAELARIVRRSRRHPRRGARRGRRDGPSPRARGGTPRVANRLLKRVRDWAEVRGSGVVDAAAADAALALLEVDELGLDRLDREILGAICAALRRRARRPLDARRRGQRGGRHARGRLRALPAPAGLLQRTPRGRAATRRAPSSTSGSIPRASPPCSEAERPTRAQRVPCAQRMAHLFICPNCGNRTTETDRTAGFRRQRRRAARSAASASSSSCSTTTTRRPTPRSSSATSRAASSAAGAARSS